MPWPGAIYWINELLTNTWAWLIEMPVWILFCVMKLEHWQMQPVGLILSFKKWWEVTGIIHATKAAGLCWVHSQGEDTKHLLLHLPGRFAARHFSWVKSYWPYIATLFAFLPSALTFLTAYCDLLPKPAITNLDWCATEDWCGIQSSWKESLCIVCWACSWIYVFSGLIH